MASHIQSVAGSGIPKVSKGEFYERIRPGDQLYCSGSAPESEAIKALTGSPWSHVLMCWLPGGWIAGLPCPWLTLEATFGRGVHVGLLADYVDRYDGDLVLARRPRLTQQWIEAELNRGLTLLDDRYDWQQEISIAARKLIKSLPLLQPKNELYCSGLQYAMSVATPYPLKRPAASMPTPEDNWTDPTVEPVCALVRA